MMNGKGDSCLERGQVIIDKKHFSLLSFFTHTFTGVVFRLGPIHYDIRQTAHRHSHLPASLVSRNKNFLGGFSDLSLIRRKFLPGYKRSKPT